MIDAHHGQVDVVNTGEGCRFEVRLPLPAVRDAPGPGGGGASDDEPEPEPEGLLIPGL